MYMYIQCICLQYKMRGPGEATHYVLKSCDALLQKVGAHFIILHNTGDLQLHDPIPHWHQFGYERQTHKSP